MKRAYAHAIAAGYRFYSYGDACLAVPRAVLIPTARHDAKPFPSRCMTTDGAARRGEIVTPHGTVQTPAFMPVGTQATVKGLMPETVRATGAEIVLGNTYHLMLRPGAERIAALGGLHAFMNWPLPILTDSGGFQVMSLSRLRKVDEQRRHLPLASRRRHDRAVARARDRDPGAARRRHRPCSSTNACGCRRRATRSPAPWRLSLRWAERCKRAFEGRAREGYALFGIVQGGDDTGIARARARARSPRWTFDGYAIGGLAVGEPQDVMLKIVEETAPLLPADAPALPDGRRHAARPARGGRARHRHVRLRACRPATAATAWPSPASAPINLANARHADDPRPLDEQARTRRRAPIRAPICII